VSLRRRVSACCVFDFTGLGSSGGDFAATNFSSNIADLIAAGRKFRIRQQFLDDLAGHDVRESIAELRKALLERRYSAPQAIRGVSYRSTMPITC
jgi:hypothetical protein